MRITILSLLTLFFLLSSPPANGNEKVLFSKIGIQPLHDRKKVPDLCLGALKGEKVSLKDYKGKIIFLNFWATWCGPCKEEMPSMETLYQQFKGRDFVLFTISVDYEGVEVVRKFFEKHRYHFPALLDPESKTLDLFQVTKIPTTLIIDKKGKLIGRIIGPRNWSCPEVFSLLEYLLDDRSNKIVLTKD